MAGLAFLVQLLEARNDHAQQLNNDRGRDVGHDAHGEDRYLQQRSATEQVHELVETAAGVAGGQTLLDVCVVHAGCRNVHTGAVDRDDGEREQQLASQVRRPEYPGNGAKQASS